MTSIRHFIFCSAAALVLGVTLLSGTARSVYARSADGFPPSRNDFSMIARSDWSGTPLENLPPEERERIKKNYERFKNLPPQERERIRQNFKEWQKLPPEEKQILRERYKQMDPENRPHHPDRFRQGPPPVQR